MSSSPEYSKGKSRKSAPASQPGAVFVPSNEEPSEIVLPNRSARNNVTADTDTREGARSSSGRNISSNTSSPQVSRNKKSFSKLYPATRPGAVAVSDVDSNYSMIMNAKSNSMFENVTGQHVSAFEPDVVEPSVNQHLNDKVKPHTFMTRKVDSNSKLTDDSNFETSVMNQTTSPSLSVLKKRTDHAITPGAVHVMPTTSNTEITSREDAKEKNFMARTVTLHPDQLSVITAEGRESQMSRGHSGYDMNSFDRQILGAPQPPGAILESKPGAQSVISSHDDMATRKDPKARYRTLHQEDIPSKFAQMNEKQSKESFVRHAEHLSPRTDAEYQKQFEEKAIETGRHLERPEDSFDPTDSWDSLSKDQDTKMLDNHADPNKLRFPEQEQAGQVAEPHGIIVTGDRGMAIHPDTMFGTTLPGNFGPSQDNGLAVAVAVNEDDDDRFLPSAIEYDPDAKPPLYLNRRFRLYMIATLCLFFLVIFTIIIGFVVLRGGSSTSLNNNAPTFAPTSLEEGLYLDQFAQSLGYQEWQFTEDSPYGRAAKWIMEEDERELSPYNDGLLQRFLLAVFYFVTTSNGKSPWLSCNPDFTNSSNEMCDFQTYSLNSSEQVVYIPEPSYRWLSKVHECAWAGNLCDDSNITRAIELLGQNITGTLPTELAALPYIQSIALAFNKFTGTLPIEYGSPDNVRHLINLELHGNQFTGTIPKEYYSLTNLQSLNIGQNHLTGTLSSEIGSLSNLKGLHIFSNMISGSIPTEIGKLEPLSFTRHGENILNGTIPTELGNLLQIQELQLERNLLTGSIPSELGLLTDMTDLTAYENRLEGTIPSALNSLSKLSYLVLHSNFLSGSINTGIGNLTAITGLWLSRNQLTGTIPTEVGNLPSLGLLWLHSNKLVGSVPTQICELMNVGMLDALQTDCFPVGNEPNPCPCCTTCCNRDTEICSAVNANDDST